ncbi:sigma-70 family RNA polymerase sigma factor [Streptomyces inhibens]|uniref:sigma-70 family RNA polymerase sigma factor n=1 Tax=Streptomyces inhibens TaxID=2293571 RepID=UPI001EE719A4|nr:sigma-70 family RNA polymerase sigma factor [Streptomyces inhibens]UKY53472.1 sigma-70 family RNA polymerase sigma factor [Streptomyces inhibens]
MDEQEFLAERFEQYRARLRAVAYRVLGSTGEADDAVQEAWLRLSRSDTEGVANLGGWLTTVVARVALNMLRSRETRREDPWDMHRAPAGNGGTATAVDPEQQAVLADSVGGALLVVLDTLAPAERLAFVLHDMFAVPFDEIAPIVERSPGATRQLASRARRRVQGTANVPETDIGRQREVVDAFLAASRGGDFAALLALLDPEVELRTDAAAALAGASAARGAAAVAETFAGRAKAAQPALIDGFAGLVWAPGGKPRVVFGFTIRHGKVVAIELLADAGRIDQLDLELLDG